MISKNLWKSNQDLATACLCHPFVQGIANGTLPQKSFAYYVGQDAFFLKAFARAYSIAAAKSDEWKTFELFHTLAGGVKEELELHQTYAAKWGVNLENITPGFATRRYTDFLLATAWGNNIGAIATAMTPCMRLYAFLGQQLATPKIPEHQYSQWIRTYSTQEFLQLVQNLEKVTDRYAENIQETESIYCYAMVCERDFFQAAWEMGEGVYRIH
ncbi:MAG: TenA family protein [Trichodesmium sp. St16_bin4-tuft]|nr:TenA family protein [Trichodesmium sp. St2_bin6]MDE5099575.1 TenA family protein [Trichodesmium sp. St16_bin4-tuft]MDE5104862.1 TenA family protein [Trichodesmium sp. St19_bin2]